MPEPLPNNYSLSFKKPQWLSLYEFILYLPPDGGYQQLPDGL
jgi:hypothetical protein